MLSNSQVTKNTDIYKRQILGLKQKRQNLEGKVFVYITVHEVMKKSKLFRIVKFHRIS